MRKLLSKPSGSQSEPQETSTIGLPAPVPLLYQPSEPQDAVFQARVPIAVVDKSPDGSCAVLAGHHILKTLRFDGLDIRESFDLRALISSQPSPRASSNASIAEQLSIRDVKWATGAAESTIFTACLGGKIFQYDLNKIGSRSASGMSGVESFQTLEDSRQINTLDINPHRGTYLLSGGQDGLVRCFDIRAPPSRAGTGPSSSFRQVQSFRCNADSVRHIKWSPKDGFYFACGTEQGFVLKWDIRKPTAPILRINSHEKACCSISWHPDGEHLISGGSDKKCYVWDMSKNADKRQKPKWTISTPASVAAVAWRPGQWSSTCRGLRATQVAVTYDVVVPKRSGINAVHIWDLARTSMPYKIIERFDCSPSAILWQGQDLLWTAGQDGLFNQCDVAHAPRVVDRTAVSTLTFSSCGDVVAFLDERPPVARLRYAGVRTVTPKQPLPAAQASHRPEPPPSPVPVGRSDSEDDALETFILPRQRARRKRRASSIQPSSGPASPAVGPLGLSLEQALKMTGSYRPQQIMAIGNIPSSARRDVYGYLTATYLNALEEGLFSRAPGDAVGSLPDRVSRILNRYATAAENVNQFRLAQVWRIIDFAMNLLLSQRAQFHQEQRLAYATLAQLEARNGNARRQPTVEEAHRQSGFLRPNDGRASGRDYARSLLSEEMESTSNLPTPLARPSDGLSMGDGRRGSGFTDGDPNRKQSIGDLVLPTAAYGYGMAGDVDRGRHQGSLPLSEGSHLSDRTRGSNMEGYDFYDAEAIVKAIQVPLRPRPHGSNASEVSDVTNRGSEGSFGGRVSMPAHLSIHPLSTSNGSGHHSMASPGGYVSPSDAIRSHAEGLAPGGHGTKPGTQPSPSAGAARLFRLRDALLRSKQNADGLLLFPPKQTLHGTNQADAQQPKESAASSGPGVKRSTSFTNGNKMGSGDASEPDGNRPEASVVESDYLPWPKDPPYPFPLTSGHTTGDGDEGFGRGTNSAMDPYTIVTRALSFELRSSPLNASAMIMLLKPLLPVDVIDKVLATAVLRQHHRRLMDMQLFLEAALLRKLCVQGWPGGGGSGGVSEWAADTTYPSVASQAQKGVGVGYICSRCHYVDHSPQSHDRFWRCDRCHDVLAPCAVCGHRDVSLKASGSGRGEGGRGKRGRRGGGGGGGQRVLSTWWYCAGCGHGGHSTCLESWHSARAEAAVGTSLSHGALPDGCCPLDGCGHACLPGRWRAECHLARSEEAAAMSRDTARTAAKSAISGAFRKGDVDRSVRADGHEVLPSRAVDLVRDFVTSRGDATLWTMGSSGGSAGAAASDGRERRKSVKFAGTDDRGL